MLTKSLKRLLCSALSLPGIRSLFSQRLKNGNVAIILNLHRVSPEGNPFWQPLPPPLFERLLEYLRREFHISTLNRLSEVKTDQPVAVLSFDDGYADFTDYAAPLLRKHGIAVNMNIIPSSVESALPPWNVRLYDWLAASPAETLYSLRIPGFATRLAGDDNMSKARFGLALSRFLKLRPKAEREELWKPLEPMVNSLPRSTYTRMMSRQDVLDAARDHEIGAHSFSHESMGFESDEFFQDDFRQCRAYFSESLNLPLDIYAFPNGSYRESQTDYLLRAGIRHVLLVDELLSRRSGRVLNRVTVAADSWPELQLTALGYRAGRAR